MANLSESAVWDAGIYQLEITDPVAGGAEGVSNAQAKSLANRTVYLKNKVDKLISGELVPEGLAPINSPAFTGEPECPTPPLGDNDQSLANSMFVQKTLGGFIQKNVAGGSNVSLSAVEAGNGIIELVGMLTGNISVIVPVSPTRSWIFKNSTTGSYSILIKTAAGTGVYASRKYNSHVFTDGSNVYEVSSNKGRRLDSYRTNFAGYYAIGSASWADVPGFAVTVNVVDAGVIADVTARAEALFYQAGHPALFRILVSGGEYVNYVVDRGHGDGYNSAQIMLPCVLRNSSVALAQNTAYTFKIQARNSASAPAQHVRINASTDYLTSADPDALSFISVDTYKN